MTRYYFNPGKILRAAFPEQTKSALHIIIWTIIFIVDMVAMFFLLERTGFSWWDHPGGANGQNLYICALIGGGLLIFWLETIIYNKIHSLFR